MEHATVERLRAWAEATFADREWVQKDELLAAAKDADLPGDAKRALKELPQARWSRRRDALASWARSTSRRRARTMWEPRRRSARRRTRGRVGAALRPRRGARHQPLWSRTKNSISPRPRRSPRKPFTVVTASQYCAGLSDRPRARGDERDDLLGRALGGEQTRG